MTTKQKPYTVVVAGSTARTADCLKALFRDDRFEIVGVLTPVPKIVGRKKDLIINPIHDFAQKNNINTVLIEKRIDATIRENVNRIGKFDILLVVDFGYLVPRWLLEIPDVAPLNIHPSDLPSWRGSSPGQYALLFGETQSAVTLMVMNEKLDEGPIITQLPFPVPATYDSAAYYTHAFALICEQLANLVTTFCDSRISTPQPLESPTPIAALLSTQSAFIPWKLVKQAMDGIQLDVEQLEMLNEPLRAACAYHNNSLAITLERASKAFVPWPSLWTTVHTRQGEKRMKLLELKIVEKTKLAVVSVQIEGKNPTAYEQVRENILEK